MPSELSATEAAAILGLTPARVRQLIAQLRIKPLRMVGQTRVYAEADIRKWLTKRPKAGWRKGRKRS